MISESVFEGIKLGLLLSIMIGPVFFALLTTSMDHGFKQAAILAFGVLLSDLVYVISTYFGVHFLSQFPLIEKSLGYLGGMILIGFGLTYIRKKETNAQDKETKPVSSGKSFFKGFGINGINPFVFLFWISIASMVTVKESWEASQISLFYGALLLTVFGIDLAKGFLANQLAHLVTPRVRRYLNIGVGLLICYFGIKMLWTTYYLSI
jgi:threonine/homoserine/homoserine lactone efflux protein